MEQINPKMIIVFIDDLLRVRKNLKKDKLYNRVLGEITLKLLAEWRDLAIDLIQKYEYMMLSRNHRIDWIIFAREHPIQTFIDLVIGQKPRIYLSYHITGEEDFEDIERFKKKLSEYFVCIDPYTIKDWNIVTYYDKALEEGIKDENITIPIRYSTGNEQFEIPLKEIEEAIDLIRTQIVYRDFRLISSVHATVVYHRSNKPSYGVMAEIIHSVRYVNRPVYVLYPFKSRPSPFFEHFIRQENMIHGDENREILENRLLEILKADYKKWATFHQN